MYFNLKSHDNITIFINNLFFWLSQFKIIIIKKLYLLLNNWFARLLKLNLKIQTHTVKNIMAEVSKLEKFDPI